jgi:hypothetical protein
VALAPAIGALVGWIVPPLWRGRSRLGSRAALAAMLAVTVVWAFVLLGRTPDWLPWLRWVLLLAGLPLCAALLLPPRSARHATTLVAATALVIGLAGPTAYAAETAGHPNSGATPSAGPTGVGGFGGRAAGGGAAGVGGRPGGGGFPQGPGTGQPPGFPGRTGGFGGTLGTRSTQTVNSALVTLLRTDSGSYRWAAAMTSASGAAPYQLASGQPIMAIGGFNGTDQSLTLAAFQQLVSTHDVHYFIAGGGFGGGGGQGGTGRSDDASTIQSWVESHFTSRTVGGVTVYDLTSASRNIGG